MQTTLVLAADSLSWPILSSENRPWTFWWWPGSAVDTNNLTRELQRYHAAGLGGVHIIPIYGAKGSESNYISYLSPRWMDMLAHTVAEARQLDMGVDMTTGTGWCLGGPTVGELDANSSVVVKTLDVPAGEKLNEKFDPVKTQMLAAFSADGQSVELTSKISSDGGVDFTATNGTWRVYAISLKPSSQKVKRAAPGGEGWMLNPFYPAAMENYLNWFDTPFTYYTGPKPRALYQDSYEYRSDWSPDFFRQFERMRGYKLQTELPALFGTNQNDRAARVKSDYRETISDLMAEDTMPVWAGWARENGFITRYQAHGAPGNLLDLYALAEIPETEMFRTDRSVLVSKFASSAAHVTGRKLVSAETGTWLKEHFTETLADLKYLADDMFLSGVNHIFYHGTCYSPDEAAWPGWLFYASTEMNPRNSIWRDAPALNTYIARCQSILQAGKPDNDVLLYWPIHDYWHSPTGMVQHLRIHNPDWFENQAVGKAAGRLQNRGYAFDYVSDLQLGLAKTVDGKIRLPGGDYRVVVVPVCEHIPLATLEKLLALAESGATVIFENQLPTDVPGWSNLETRRTEFKKLADKAQTLVAAAASVSNNHILTGDLETALTRANIPHEPLSDHAGLLFIRRAVDGGHVYFIANRGEQPVDELVSLATPAKSVVLIDALSGATGIGKMRGDKILLKLKPGESIILRTLTNAEPKGRISNYCETNSQPIEIRGLWQVKFVTGGPALPASFETTNLVSWTDNGDSNAQNFAGTAVYSITFDKPDALKHELLPSILDLGKVCQSARVRLNGKDLGTLIAPPFRVVVDKLKPKDNLLEVEVTNVSANRIRDMDRRGVTWKIFHDINFVNQNYKPFDASDWPLYDSGLLGPVTLSAVVFER